MRITLLCSLLFVCLAQAQDSPKANDHSSAVERAFAGDSDSILQLTPEDETDSVRASCAYIRAYRVKREARGSDVTVPAGYTTCVPSKRFEMRSAVITKTEPAGDK